jgi:hypothetical protein
MYPTTHLQMDWQSEYRRGFDWRLGNTNWSIDYPRSDRHLALAVRRLTRLQTRSVEQTINLEDDDGLQLPVAIRGRDGALGDDAAADREIPRVPAARRIFHVRTTFTAMTSGWSS